MKKLRLNVDALKVDSFSPEAVPKARGTVDGHAIVNPYPTAMHTGCIICPNTYDTCGYTENNTCIRTIHVTCLCETTWPEPDTSLCPIGTSRC